MCLVFEDGLSDVAHSRDVTLEAKSQRQYDFEEFLDVDGVAGTSEYEWRSHGLGEASGVRDGISLFVDAEAREDVELGADQ